MRVVTSHLLEFSDHVMTPRQELPSVPFVVSSLLAAEDSTRVIAQ